MAYITTGNFSKIPWPGLQNAFTIHYGGARQAPPLEFGDIPLSTLKALWLAKYGMPRVSMAQLYATEEDFWIWAFERIKNEEGGVTTMSRKDINEEETGIWFIWK